MAFFVKIGNGFKPLIIFAKNFIIDVWQSPKYASSNANILNLSELSQISSE